MSVSNGQPANETTFNNGFMSRSDDTSTVGEVDLLNNNPASGADVVNVQRELNSEASYTGKPLNAAKDALPTWSSTASGAPTDDLTARAEALTGEFDPATGHDHDGTNSKAVSAASIANARLKGAFVRGINLVAVSGATLDVSTQMAASTPSSGDAVEGVVTLAPTNLVIIRSNAGATQGDAIVDGLGNIVYGRIAEAAGVWTLSFYTNVSGTETAFAMTGQNVAWYFQQLFNPFTNAPIYSELAAVPSENATQDVIDATPSQRGLVSTGAQTFGGSKTFQDNLLVGGALSTLKQDVATAATIAALSSTKSFVRLTGSTSTDVQGVAAGTDGQILLIHNASTAIVTFKNENAGASANNRMKLPQAQDIQVGADASVELIYSLAENRWKLRSGSGSGSGSGGAGINYVGQDAVGAVTSPDNRGAEGSVGDWLAFANTTPGDLPTMDDITGTPTGNVALSRTTSGGEVLSGRASFKIVKGAASAQGDGYYIPVIVPEGYNPLSQELTMLFKVLSGSLVSGDVLAFVADTATGAVYKAGVIVGSSGKVSVAFSLPLGVTDIVVGLFFASTSALALTFVFDDITVGPRVSVKGLAGSTGQEYFKAVQGLGTAANNRAVFERVGNKLRVRGQGAADAVTASNIFILLPDGLAIDYYPSPSGQKTQTQLCGKMSRFTSSATPIPSTSNGPFVLFTDGSSTDRVWMAQQTSSNNLDFSPGNTLCNPGEYFDYDFEVPIAGWNSELTLQESTTFDLADVLAFGTRVTGGPPTKLGEYNSEIRGAASTAYSETNGDPAIPPSIANGIVLYASSSGGFAAGDLNNQPSLYRFFIGKNKAYKMLHWENPGRTGTLYTDVRMNAAGPNLYGVDHHYDPVTGILTVQVPVFGSMIGQYTGLNDVIGSVAASYFTVMVSDNVVGVGIEGPVVVIARKDAVTNTISNSLSPFTYDLIEKDTHGAFDGNDFIAPVDGPYAVDYSDYIVVNGAVNNSAILAVKVNGSVVNGSFAYGTAQVASTNIGLTVGKSIMVDLKKDDVLSINSYRDAGISAVDGVQGRLSIHLVK